MLAKRFMFVPLVAAAALALAACDRAAVPADPSTGPIGEETPTDEAATAPDPAPDLVAPPNGDPLPPEAFEGESITVPADEEAAPAPVADEELQQRLDDAVTDAQRRAGEIVDEVLGGGPPDDPGAVVIETPPPEAEPAETAPSPGSPAAMSVSAAQPPAAAVLPEPAMLEADTVAASRDGASNWPFVGTWAGDPQSCGLVDQPGSGPFVVVTPDTVREDTEMCVITSVNAGGDTASLQLACPEGGGEVARVAELQMADTQTMRFEGADGFGYDLVRCRLP